MAFNTTFNNIIEQVQPPLALTSNHWTSTTNSGSHLKSLNKYNHLWLSLQIIEQVQPPLALTSNHWTSTTPSGSHLKSLNKYNHLWLSPQIIEHKKDHNVCQ
jgi:hypothetical protein